MVRYVADDRDKFTRRATRRVDRGNFSVIDGGQAAPVRPRAPRTGTITETIAVGIVDAQRRVPATRIAASVGWPSGGLSAKVTGPAVTLVPANGPATTTASLDDKGRIRVTPAILRTLGAEPGDPILLVAEPNRGTVHLIGTRAVIQALDNAGITGPSGA